MITYHAIDSQNIYAGTLQLDPFAALPPGTMTPPPATTGAEVAQLHGTAWVILPEYPAQPALPPTVPQEVTMRRARLALHSAGLLDAVEAAVAAASRAVQIEWEFAGTVNRTWPTLLALQTPLGLTDQQIDDLFTLAATL